MELSDGNSNASRMLCCSRKQLIAAMDARMCELKQRRKALSRQLQEQLHAAYSLTNFSGQSLSLQQLIPGGSMPTGTPAATHGLKPLASNGGRVCGESPL